MGGFSSTFINLGFQETHNFSWIHVWVNSGWRCVTKKLPRHLILIVLIYWFTALDNGEETSSPGLKFCRTRGRPVSFKIMQIIWNIFFKGIPKRRALFQSSPLLYRAETSVTNCIILLIELWPRSQSRSESSRILTTSETPQRATTGALCPGKRKHSRYLFPRT